MTAHTGKKPVSETKYPVPIYTKFINILKELQSYEKIVNKVLLAHYLRGHSNYLRAQIALFCFFTSYIHLYQI